MKKPVLLLIIPLLLIVVGIIVVLIDVLPQLNGKPCDSIDSLGGDHCECLGVKIQTKQKPYESICLGSIKSRDTIYGY